MGTFGETFKWHCKQIFICIYKYLQPFTQSSGRTLTKHQVKSIGQFCFSGVLLDRLPVSVTIYHMQYVKNLKIFVYPKKKQVSLEF